MSSVSKKEALDRLLSGNRRYVNNRLTATQVSEADRSSLVGGQSPFAVILTCADSRVVPEKIFDVGLGELFVIRVAGNIPNTSSIASIEYAVAHLGVELVVVLGHQNCGAVQAAISGGELSPSLTHLVSHITPAVENGTDTDLQQAVEKNAGISAETIAETSAICKTAVQQNKLSVLPACYFLDTGKVVFNS